MLKKFSRLPARLRQERIHVKNDRQVEKLAKQIAKNAAPANQAPVIFFNASTRLQGMSLNAGFSLLASWAVRLQGAPVIHFVCEAGMSHCMLGSVLNNPTDKPPCAICTKQSRRFFEHADTRWFQYRPTEKLAEEIKNLTAQQLASFVYDEIPLGELVLPAIRWVLRCYHLTEDEETRYLFRQYILSAENIVRQFSGLLDTVKPQKVIVFNGMSFPEAAARWVAARKNIPVITHEVGLQPFTAFFTYGQATAYPISIPNSFVLDEEQERKLDQYLEQRFQGNFSMAGVRFWPTIKALSSGFLKRAENFRQIVPIFSNVIFDTSQSHANVIFDHMFDWLDCVLEIAARHPDTLFVLRAHPDEARPGKASRENVASWAKSRRVETFENVIFVDATEHFSSYELIQRSKFVLIYNSTIGMEAILLGTPVISGGKARFTDLPTVFLPDSRSAFVDQVESFLHAEEISVPGQFKANVRRFLYTQLYRVSLPFGEFLEEDQVWNGYVKLKEFSWRNLQPENSAVLQTLVNGILKNQAFELDL